MKDLLLTTIAAVVLVGCGPSEAERAMIRAVQTGNMEAVKKILAAGEDVNASAPAGNTVLSEAVKAGNVEMVKYLIAKGARLNNAKITLFTINPTTGKTVRSYQSELDFAIMLSHDEIADLLRKHGAKTGKQLGYR